MNDATPANSSLTITNIYGALDHLPVDADKTINATPLHKTPGMHILLIALDAQAELKRHTAPGPISVQVIKGSISFRTDNALHDLSVGELLTLEANIPHSVYAHESSAFLVTKNIHT